jgi:hypothetical protein
MSAVSHRRRPWGALWSKAPWDGRPTPAEVVVVPTTAAALTPPADRGHLPRGRQLLRAAFGRVWAGAPWAGRLDPLTVTPPPGLTDTPPPVGHRPDVVPAL